MNYLGNSSPTLNLSQIQLAKATAIVKDKRRENRRLKRVRKRESTKVYCCIFKRVLSHSVTCIQLFNVGSNHRFLLLIQKFMLKIVFIFTTDWIFNKGVQPFKGTAH